MPTARPDTQTITNDNTPRLNNSLMNARARSGGVKSARRICVAKTASLPRWSTKRMAAQPRSCTSEIIRPPASALGRSLGDRDRLVQVLVEEAGDARVGAV